MNITYKQFEAAYNHEKLPRKLKKAILGKKMNKSLLNRLLKSVRIISSANTMYESPKIEPYTFCPFCGYIGMKGTGNLTAYPEHWEYFHCIKCDKVVGYIDNSAFIHALECEDYNPVF